MNTNIQLLANDALIATTRTVSTRCTEAMAELLLLLGEVEVRRLFVERGFSTMHQFCTVDLGFSDAEAGTRLEAARVLRRFPRLVDFMRDARTHLTGVRMLGRILTDDNFDEVMGKATRLSKFQLEELIVTYVPKPLALDSVRKAPSRQGAAPVFSVSTPPGTEAPNGAVPNDVTPVPAPPSPTGSLALLFGAQAHATVGLPAFSAVTTPTQPHSTPPPAEPVPPSAQPHPTPPLAAPARPSAEARAWAHGDTTPVAAGLYRFRFTGDAEMHELLEEARALMRHRNRSGVYGPIFKDALRLLVAQVKKERFGIGAKPRASKKELPSAATSQSPSSISDGPAASSSAAPGEQCGLDATAASVTSGNSPAEAVSSQPMAGAARLRTGCKSTTCMALRGTGTTPFPVCDSCASPTTPSWRRRCTAERSCTRRASNPFRNRLRDTESCLESLPRKGPLVRLRAADGAQADTVSRYPRAEAWAEPCGCAIPLETAAWQSLGVSRIRAGQRPRSKDRAAAQS